MSRPFLESDLPAYAQSLGISVHGLDGEYPVLTVAFGPTIEGRPGHFHGGATAGLLETAGYAALRRVLLREQRALTMKPINITMQYLAAGKQLQTYAIGRITRLGRRNANIAAEAWQSDRARPIATAVMNILTG
ncbi:MAG: PaaI family thioesterase [Pseudomonadota bacterium]